MLCAPTRCTFRTARLKMHSHIRQKIRENAEKTADSRFAAHFILSNRIIGLIMRLLVGAPFSSVFPRLMFAEMYLLYQSFRVVFLWSLANET